MKKEVAKKQDIDFSKYDVVVAGAGLSGAIIARRFADKKKKVLIVEKRDHIAGNVYDKVNEKKLLFHVYGPHIFHTNDDEVIKYVKQFAKFIEYRWKVNASINKKEVPLPINFKSIDLLFNKTKANLIKDLLQKEYPNVTKTFIFDLLSSKNKVIKEFGTFVYKNVFLNYTTKMWGVKPNEIDQSVLKRVGILLSYDDGYFNDKFQGVPKDGYTELVKNILNKKEIEIKLETDFNKIISFKNNVIHLNGKEFKGKVVYTGALDEMFKYKYGALPYRSLNFTFETLNKESYQSRGTVNYPADKKMTRITEYKKITEQKNKNWTVISKEYPGQYDENGKFNERYYPIPQDKNIKLYQKYFDLASKSKNLIVLGRLAEYKYKDMWVTIKDALNKEI